MECVPLQGYLLNRRCLFQGIHIPPPASETYRSRSARIPLLSFLAGSVSVKPGGLDR